MTMEVQQKQQQETTAAVAAVVKPNGKISTFQQSLLCHDAKGFTAWILGDFAMG